MQARLVVGRLAADHECVGEAPVDLLQGLELFARVPMECDPGGVLQGSRVGIQLLRPVEDVVLVVVEEEQLHIGMVGLQSGSQVARDEVQLVLRGENAGLPDPVVLWLVLGCDGPNRDPMVL